LALGCQSKAPTGARPGSPTVAPEQAPPPAASTARALATSGVTLRVAGARAFAPSPGLLDLPPERKLSRADFAALRLRPASPLAAQATDSGDLLLIIDEQTPRPLLESGALLRSVVDEDRELSPGWHALVSFIVSPEQILLEQRHFELELDVPRATPGSGCVLLEPPGTVHLATGSDIELVAAPLGPDALHFEYFVDSAPGAQLRVPALEAALAHGVTRGDHQMGVRCYDAAGALVGQSQRVVTVNLDG
jgi:hypothetical protein